MNHLNMNQLFEQNFNINLAKSEDVVIEVYRESESKEEWEVPVVSIGIRIFEDGRYIQDISLFQFSNFGLFSYQTTNRNKLQMDLALNVANIFESTLSSLHRRYATKIRKRVVSNQFLYLVAIPTGYTTEMPEAEERLLKLLDFQAEEQKLLQEIGKKPDDVIKAGLQQIENERTLYLEKIGDK